MARTAITPTALPGHGGLTEPAGTAVDPTNGHVIVPPRSTRKLILRIDATFAGAKDYTVKAGAGAMANIGADLVVSCNAQKRYVGPLDYQRFAQADGSIFIDVAVGATGTITAFYIPEPF